MNWKKYEMKTRFSLCDHLEFCPYMAELTNNKKECGKDEVIKNKHILLSANFIVACSLKGIKE